MMVEFHKLQSGINSSNNQRVDKLLQPIGVISKMIEARTF